MSAVRGALLIALALGAWVLAGCGDSDRGTSRRGAPPPVGVGDGGGAAAPLDVKAENGLRGTLAWRLQAGRARGRVEGYVSEEAPAAGDTVRFYVRAPGARSVRIDLFRIGWYGGLGGRRVIRSPILPARDQSPCAHDRRTGLTECRWNPTWTLRLPSTLVSGVYVGRLLTDTGAVRDTLLVVRSRRPGRLLAVISTATYQAYNDYGGDDLYPAALPVGTTGTTQGVEVSFDRPYDTTTGAGQLFARDVAGIRFLEREGYDMSYTTDTAIDRHPGEARAARAIVVIGHSEYWSQRMRDAVTAARDGGTGLALLSSDTMGWRVRYAPAGEGSSEAGTPGHVIVAYKEHASLDPDRGLPTGRFPDGGAGLTATRYENCITGRLPGGPPPVYRYYAWTPSGALRPSWLFVGTGFRAGSSVAGIVGYELDRLAPSPPAGTVLVGRGHAVCQGSRASSSSAATTLYRARSGAYVFSAGTMGWQLGLSPVPSTSPDTPTAPDPRLVRLTENLLARMLAR